MIRQNPSLREQVSFEQKFGKPGMTFTWAAALGRSMERMAGAAEAPIITDNWLPANGGTETPFTTRTGARLLYCWQPSTGKHAYLDCGTDIILTDDEARQALATY